MAFEETDEMEAATADFVVGTDHKEQLQLMKTVCGH